MSKVYMYVVARDFGFAPNPFHGTCTLATCKPVIRRNACKDDWVVGMAGGRLKAVGRCVFAMQVTQAMGFDQYWSDPEYLDKRPVRNGSSRMMVGDNIYCRDPSTGAWLQADSHHSSPDGSQNQHNVDRDTSSDRVLVSRRFFYFGRAAPAVPAGLLSGLGFKNAVGHRVFQSERCGGLLEWLHKAQGARVNEVSGLPFQFHQTHARYSVKTDKISL